jgi:glycosyltransferase involved in cell wall biosynthesis
MSECAQTLPWVLVSTGFHRTGGMEEANFAFARYLLNHGAEVHLVAHRVDRELTAHLSTRLHLVPKPVGSFMLGEPLLSRKGMEVANTLKFGRPGVRVLVNGGCCIWPDVNWVHCVHAAWKTHDDGAPLWFKTKNRATKALTRRQEIRALRRARFIVANSKKTKDEIVTLIGTPEATIRTIYLGTDSESKPFGLEERLQGRAWLGMSAERPIIAFVGAMGYDTNKGFDTLWTAWKRLCARPDWDADLVVAGGGRAVSFWKKRIHEARLGDRVTFLGFTDRVNSLLAASDLLVSPVRYEAFGLSVREALAGGIPAIVSAAAGIAELYPHYLKDLLLRNPEDVEELIERLLSWRANIFYWKQQIEPLSRDLRSYSWEHMARDIVESTSIPLTSDGGMAHLSTHRLSAAVR